MKLIEQTSTVFKWTRSIGNSKRALVSWEMVCQPRVFCICVIGTGKLFSSNYGLCIQERMSVGKIGAH